MSNEEIQEDCILYLEYNYPEDVEKVSEEDFFESDMQRFAEYSRKNKVFDKLVFKSI